MWTEITTTQQIAKLKKDDEILHHPADDGIKMTDPTGKEINSRVFKLQSIEDDLAILYSFGDNGGEAHYYSMGVEPVALLNGNWWIKKNC